MIFPILVTALSIWVSGIWCYNLFLHPLRKYPGPLLSRATSLPRLWHRLRGTAVGHAHAAHEKYGPVVRLSPTELSYITSDAWRDIYSTGRALPKEPAHNPAPGDAPRGLVQAIDGPYHAWLRHIFSPAFSQRALKEQEPLLLGHVRKLVANLHHCCRRTSPASKDGVGVGAINIADQFNFATFDIMADLAFGAPLGLLAQSAYSPWVRNVFAVFRILNIRIVLGYYLPLAAALLRHLTPRSIVERRKAHIAYAARLVDERLATATRRPDIWTLVLQGYEEDDAGEGEEEGGKRRLGLAEMHINAGVFMAAGTETTATCLTGTVWTLARHPEQMGKVVEEVRNELSGEDDFSLEKLARLPYLNAVVNESLRLYPPAPEMLARLVPPGGVEICGEVVPGGTAVGVHQWPANHSRRNFYQPDAFIPERWLPEAADDERFAKDDKKVVVPFSAGPRSCIGKNLALHEIRLILAHVLWHFDVSLSAEAAKTDWMQQRSYLVWEKKPLIVELREASHS